MTAKEFWTEFWTEVYRELEFLHYEEFIKEQNDGKAWYTTTQFIEHGKRHKKQLLNHIYSKRGFDLIDLKYKYT